MKRSFTVNVGPFPNEFVSFMVATSHAKSCAHGVRIIRTEGVRMIRPGLEFGEKNEYCVVVRVLK